MLKLTGCGMKSLRSCISHGHNNTPWTWRACLQSECWFARWKAVPDVWLAVEAFASRSWGHGAGAGWWSRLANPHLKHGTHWQLTRSTWICCFWRSMAVSGRSKTFARGFGTGPWSWWWMGRGVLPELQCVKHGASGNLAPSSGGTLARWRYHPWHEVARTRSTKPIVRSWDGWLTSPMVRLQDCPWPAAGVEPSLGMHAPQGLCIHCDRDCPTWLCCNELHATGGRRITFPSVQPGQSGGALLSQLHGAEVLPQTARRRLR